MSDAPRNPESDDAMSASLSRNDCDQKAAELSFDVTKQFLTLAFAGIAFVVGLSFSQPGVVSTVLLWSVIGTFSLSVIFGLGYLMRGVGQLSVAKSYDVYSGCLRTLAVVQISLVLLGVVLLVPVMTNRPETQTTATSGQSHDLKISIGDKGSIEYPLAADKTYNVQVDGEKVTISESRP